MNRGAFIFSVLQCWCLPRFVDFILYYQSLLCILAHSPMFVSCYTHQRRKNTSSWPMKCIDQHMQSTPVLGLAGISTKECTRA